jgi:hypoxanthine phosphoribosyltransferase
VRRLIEADEIQAKVADLGRQISEHYHGRPLTVIGVLTGSMVLVSDLIRCIDLPLRVGMVQASSYRGAAIEPDKLSLDLSRLPDVRGRDVLVVDDIFDTGRTLGAIIGHLRASQASSVRGAVLLWKDRRRESEWEPDYFGFKIPDVFVVGYGLDYNDEHRSLPYVAALDEGDLDGPR